MLKKQILLISILFGASMMANAQLPCATDQKFREAVQHNPKILEYEQAFEQQIKDGINNVMANHNARTTNGTDTVIYDIPIVVHVIHDYGADDIPDNLIYDAAKYWAVVYMCQNPDTATVIDPFKKYVGDPRIRLHMATIDPNGKPTKGVVRHRHYLTYNADDQAKLDGWPPTEYVNIWFIRTFGASATGAAAYAYYPSAAAGMPYYDGIIALADYVNTDKTIPHEMGHVLNLKHPWGDSNNPGVACGDDGVDDTPPTMGHMPSGCVASALYDVTCAVGYSVTYHPGPGIDSVVDYPDTTNAENIMDYTYCQKMFTIGQTVRMRTALTGTTAGRNNLYSPANLALTGALAPMPDLKPVSDFSVEQASGAGILTDTRTYFLTFNNSGKFVFANRSWNDTIDNVKWSFSNMADSATSISTGSIMNKFAQPGWVTVTLVSNSNAGSDTLVDPNAVYVADTTSLSCDSYTQEFASAADITKWPMMNYYKNQYKWQFFNGAGWGGTDNSCVKFRSFDTTSKTVGTPLGDHDDFYTPAFNLSGFTGNYYLNFYTSGAHAPSSGLGWGTNPVGDSLEVDVSISGGARWAKIAGYKASDIENAGISGVEFKPTLATQWKPRAINIPATYRAGNTFFRFRVYSGNIGNNIYLDHLSFQPWPADVQEVVSTQGDFNIFPNPTNSDFNVAIKTGRTGRTHIQIKDITGRLVYSTTDHNAAESIVTINIAKNSLPAAGIYFVSAETDGVTNTRKLVVF